MEEQKEVCECPECKKRAEKEAAYNEMSLAFLLALMPMLVVTLFGQIGLF
ncbi:MAG: hypothetical protein WC906_04180 [Parcubacteria group bacterium]|jgi:hypothetical protein